MKKSLKELRDAVRDRLKGLHGTGGGKTWILPPKGLNKTQDKTNKDRQNER